MDSLIDKKFCPNKLKKNHKNYHFYSSTLDKVGSLEVNIDLRSFLEPFFDPLFNDNLLLAFLELEEIISFSPNEIVTFSLSASFNNDWRRRFLCEPDFEDEEEEEIPDTNELENQSTDEKSQEDSVKDEDSAAWEEVAQSNT